MAEANFRNFGVLAALDVVDADNRGQDEVDDSIRKEGDNQANNCVKNSVFRVGDFFAVATRENVAKTAVNKHNNRDDTDNKKDNVGDTAENAVVAN